MLIAMQTGRIEDAAEAFSELAILLVGVVLATVVLVILVMLIRSLHRAGRRTARRKGRRGGASRRASAWEIAGQRAEPAPDEPDA